MDDIFTKELQSDVMQETEKTDLPFTIENFEEQGIAVLEPEIVDIPEIGEAYVFGSPFEIGETLISEQGNNVLNAQGDCGVVSVVNIVRISGLECSEDEAIILAVGNGLCDYSVLNDAGENGGTTVYQRQELLSDYGIGTTVVQGADLEQVAQYVESGHGVNMSVNAGYAWDNASYIGCPFSTNHSIVVTGTARDPETGEVLGLYVCDSGCGQQAMFLSSDKLKDAYLDVNGTLLVTNDAIR